MKKYGIFHRCISVLLSIVLVLGMIPVFATAADNAANAPAAQAMDTRVVDPNTMNEWEDYFGADKISTEFAGGVWTDKSVMTNANAFQAAITMKDPDNHFLIALSALAANQQIVGYSSAPVDVMLVLDVSGSMQGSKATTMIQAVNQTINSLLSQNNNNRVGVALYSGNTATNQNAPASSATVLLPLDRYTTTSTQTVNGQRIPAYLSISNNNVSVASGLRNGANQRVYGSKSVSGGTYIQNGIYKAWGEFAQVTDVKVPAGQAQAGAQRTPVMVLFSDGQPTVATADYTNIGTSERTYGNGSEESTTWQTVMLSQLTAAWAKGKMTAHYGTNAKFYTVGLGTGNSSYATAVLNPSSATNTTLAGYWDNYFDPDQLDNDGNVTVANSWELVKDTAVASKNYVDLYKLASNTSELLDAFKQIVESIELDTAGHVTLVEGPGEDMSGYITFVDELGMFMEVKDMKGLVLGNTLYTGSVFARKLGDGSYGTMAQPTELGDEFIRSVRERLGGLDVITAQNLVQAAYADGQIAYVSDTDFSNYLGWYSDDDGTYLGFWDKDTGITAEGAPAGATWINKSYLFQDAMNGSDMMHIVVLVATHIASGMQVIQYKIPASLIPKVTYEVELDGSDATKMQSITRKEAFPLRLVYEVGLQEGINPVNVEQKLNEAIAAGYGHAHKEADGSYAFYTNLWGAEHGDSNVDYNDPMHHNVAKSHFHPAEGNDRYYYTVDTLICSDTNGTAYNGAAAPAGDGYYRAHHYYTAAGYVIEYVPVAAEALALAVKKDDGWYVPAGTVFQQIERFKMEKDSNTTGTLEYYDHPVVVKTENKYDTYAFLGNNGKMTIMPAQGIRLTKTVTQVVAGAEDSFTFDITLSQAVAAPNVTDADGNALTGWSVNGNVITVTLKAGETVCVTDLPAGVTYTVTERKHPDYIGSSTNATGTVQTGKINAVDFVNVPRGYGNLIVSKDVDHPFVTVPDALINKEFSITVTLSGEDVANEQFAIAGTDPVEYITTDANGSFTVNLKDNGSITVAGLPEGTTFTTTENLDPDIHKGFTMDANRSVLSGTIQKDTTVQTHVVNVYKPEAPTTTVQVAGQKILTDEAGAFDWTGKSFTFRLEQYDPATGTYTNLGEKQVTQGNLSYLFADNITINALGNFYFKVSEVIPAERLEGMSYDATVGRFEVRVTDDNVDGVMEIAVFDFDTRTPIQPVNNVITYTKDFENIHTTDATYVEFPVYKNLVDPHNTGATGAGYLFELYEVIGGQVSATPAYAMRTLLVDGKGQAVFHIPVTKVGSRTFILKENAPADADKIPGMIYDAAEYTVVVEGKANAQSKLEAVVTFRDASGSEISNVTFTNVIDLEPVVLQPGVTKELVGREPLSDTEFTFTMVQTDGSFATNIPGGYSSTTSVGKGNKLFDAVTLTQVGTYYFRVTEQIGNAGGMTYDNSVYHITVNVTLENGALQKQVSFVKVGQGQTPTQTQLVQFTNTYVNNDTAEVTLQGNKNLTGRTLLPGEFSFQLSENGGVLQTVTNRADGSFVFAPIIYTAADVGTHTYTVSEVNGSKGGVGYDMTSYTVTVTVTDNGKGELVVNTSGTDGIAFNNTYTTKPVDVTLSGTKTWLNTDLNLDKPMAGGEFTFALYASNAGYSTQGQLVASTTNAADGSFGFRLHYTAPGDYYYLLRETKGDAAGTGYDTGVFHIKVVVYDNGEGKLIGRVAEILEEGTSANAINFHNTYTPAPAEITISGEKELTGRPLLDGEFEFQLKENGTVLQTVVNDGTGFSFAPISYTNSGTYVYEVVEVVPNAAVNDVYYGVTYDTSVFTVTVTVTDDGAGKLVASYTAEKAGQPAFLKFTNEYNVVNHTDFDLSGTKTLYNTTTGVNMNMADFAGKFHFDLYDAAGVRVASAKVGADGKFTFVDVPLNETGVHTFTVKEHKEDLGGITYDETVYTVTVNVTDDGQGSLVAEAPVVTLNGQAASLQFTNNYTLTPVAEQFYVSKILENKTLEDDMFSFELVQDGQVIQTVKNKHAGGVYFEEIQYTKPGTYTYTIREVQGNAGGIAYDTHEVTVTVTVTDNLDGTMNAAVVYTGNRTFTNTYTVTGDPTVTITGNKNLTGRNLADGEFAFVLTDANGNTVETTNVGGTFTFADIDLNGLGEHTFTVTEKNTGKGGVTYDDTVYTVTVTVTDNGEGGMVVGTPVITRNGVSAQLVFNNTYKAAPVEQVLTATKQYNKPLNGGEFEFVLTGDGVSQTKTNAAGGTITFDKLTFTQTGTYNYTVTETNTGKGGVTYDGTVYTVKIVVTDNGLGNLVVSSVTYTANAQTVNGMEFTNVYTAAPVEYVITAEKSYTKELTGGEFEFVLTGDGVSQTKTNAAGGIITFDKLTYTAVGDYSYTVTETNTGKGGVTYDDTVYTVTVTVSDDAQGKLYVSNVTVSDNKASGNGSVKFVNTYTVTGEPVFSIAGTKELTGRDLADGEFAFVLTDANGNTVETTNVGGAFTFADIDLNGLGEHTFTVTEKNTGKGGVTYDDTVYTVTVTVTDNGEGGMVVGTPVITRNGVSAQLVFNNTYKAAPVEQVLTATKQYNKPLNGGEFEFVLTGEGISQTKTNAAGGTITFDKLTFTQTGTYNYTVTETNTGKGGVTYDGTVYTVKIVVTDNGLGNLVVSSVTYTANAQTVNGMEFTNVYTAAPVEYGITAEKSYTKELTGGEFEFVLTGDGVSQTKTNAAGGTITFDKLTYTAVGDYSYTVTETNTGKGGVTYDDTVYTVTVTVSDDGQGKLYVSNVTVSDDKASGNGSVKFINTYTVTGEPVFSIAGTKELTGRDLADGEFVFVLTDANGNTVETTNVGGAFSFNNVELPGLGTYTYTVTEKNTGIGTITYDATVYTVTLNVVDDNVGGMTVEAPVITVNGQAAQLQFNNVYTEPNPITVDVNISKLMEGEMSPSGFTFELVQDGKVVSTAKANADGKAQMSITFTVDALGTHEFVIREANTGIDHVTYDTNTYKLQIQVTETADGQLAAAVKLNDADVESVHVQFVNKFDPPATPETGDNSHPVMIVNVMTISLLAMVVMLAALVIDRKKSEFER